MSNISRLDENYKQCHCGEKLHKRNRFAVVLQSPKYINTEKRRKEGKQYRPTSVVNYCCEECYAKMYAQVPKILGAKESEWFCHYPESYPL